MATASAAPRAGALVLATPGRTDEDVDLLRSPAAGRPLVSWTLSALRAVAQIGEIVLLVEPARVDEARALITSLGVPDVLVAGTKDGCVAVRAGLEALSTASRLVVVHEASRPLLTPDLLVTGLTALSEAIDTAAAIAAIPVKETIKQVREGVVVETLDRSRLVLLQTPHIFERAALDAVCHGVCEDIPVSGLIRAIRAAGRRVVTFPGSPEHIAVATADDLALADRFLRARHGL